MKTIVKLLAALAAVAGAIYVIATYGEQIVAWCQKVMAMLPKGDCHCKCDCTCECEDCDCEDPCDDCNCQCACAAEPTAEMSVEEPVVEEPSVEVPVVEIPADEVVANEEDFEG